jgi:hypothetical protein
VVTFSRQNAVVPIEARCEELLLGVQVVQDRIRIGLVRGREHYHLEILVRFAQAFVHEWPDIYACQHRVIFILKVYFYYNIGVLLVNVIHAMDQGLVQVENYCFLLYSQD